MKKYISCIILLFACLLMGCSSSSIELTEEENDMVAEYMAGALLKYDHYYDSKLIVQKDEETNKTENKTIQNETKTDNTVRENDKKTVNKLNDENTKDKKKNDAAEGNISLADLFAEKSYTLAYKGNMLCSTYPKDGNDIYVVEAPSGKKLAVIQISVKNTSSKKKTIDLSQEGISYVLEANGQTYSQPLLTGITNGIQYFKETIDSSKSKEAVLIFEVNNKAKLMGGSLSVQLNGKTAKITLK